VLRVWVRENDEDSPIWPRRRTARETILDEGGYAGRKWICFEFKRQNLGLAVVVRRGRDKEKTM
jgi:hypothetical protein